MQDAMAQNIEFNKNEDLNKLLLSSLQQRLQGVYEGGGKKSAEKQKEKGKLLARERIAYLLDKDAAQIEIGALAADGMYQDVGGCPSAGPQKRICAHRKLPWKTVCQSFIWWTVPVCFCRCKMKFFPIKNTSEEFLETMP